YTPDGLVDATLASARCSGEHFMAAPGTIHEVPVDAETIQDAIDAALPGDIVYVHPGVYQKQPRLRHGVRLVGAGAEQTILDAGGASDNLLDFSGAGDVVVRGF